MNPDGDVHANVQYGYDGQADETYVGFEDLFGKSADWDCNDLEFYVTTLSGPGTDIRPVPDTFSTLPLLGMSLAGLAALARRFRNL